MARAYECDRCGKLYHIRSGKHPEVYITENPQLGSAAKDLCPDCQKQLEYWWKRRATVLASCDTCKHCDTDDNTEPCLSCDRVEDSRLDLTNYEPREEYK